MKKIGFVFPGQGSQFVGMGEDLVSPFAVEAFALAEEISGTDIKSLCINGPEEELNRTINTQVAVFVVSAICLDLLSANDIKPDIVAGHSLGEYTALVGSGVIGFKEALALVGARARLMQEAADDNPGSMIAVLGLDEAEVRAVVDQLKNEGIIGIANFNCPGQLVVSGETKIIEEAGTLFNERRSKTRGAIAG